MCKNETAVLSSCPVPRALERGSAACYRQLLTKHVNPQQSTVNSQGWYIHTHSRQCTPYASSWRHPRHRHYRMSQGRPRARRRDVTWRKRLCWSVDGGSGRWLGNLHVVDTVCSTIPGRCWKWRRGWAPTGLPARSLFPRRRHPHRQRQPGCHRPIAPRHVSLGPPAQTLTLTRWLQPR